MASDRFRKTKDLVTSSASVRTGETYPSSRWIKGEVFWTLTDSVTGLETKGRMNNVVTFDAGILLARLLKGTMTLNLSEPRFGVYALAVGTGDIAWNPMMPPPGNPAQRSLYNEICRKTASSSSFIDGDGVPSGVPTNVIDISFTFSNSEAVGALTEMGLIGGDVDTNMANRNPVMPPNGPYDPTVDLTLLDTLVNYVSFPVINKPSGSTLSWVWRLTL